MKMSRSLSDRTWLVVEIARAQYALALLINGNADYNFPTGVLLRRQLIIVSSMQDRNLPDVRDRVIEDAWEALVTTSDGQSLHPLCLLTAAAFFGELYFTDNEIHTMLEIIRRSNEEIGPVQDRVSRLTVRLRRSLSLERIPLINTALSVFISRLFYANDFPFPPLVYFLWLQSDRVNRLLSTEISPTSSAEANIIDKVSLSLAQLLCEEFRMIDIEVNREWLMLTCPICRARSQGCVVSCSCELDSSATTHTCGIQLHLDSQRCLCGLGLESVHT